MKLSDDDIQMQELRIGMDPEKYNLLFSTHVQAEASVEYVTLHFIQGLPGAPAEGPNAKIVSSVVLTWQHFSRLGELCNRLIEGNSGLVRDNFLTHFKSQE
jgi:hypothetical protein